MKKKLKSLQTFIFSLSLLFIPFFLPSQSYAQTSTWEGVCVGPTEKSSDVATIQGAQCLIANIFSVAITLIGLVGFIMLIFASLKWMLAGTNAQNKDKARNMAVYAFVGLIVALCSFMILKLVSDFTGVKTILNFSIPSSDINWEERL
ncbi:MAG: pilin [Candidatus Woesebacteria bacterium]|jgi:cytochrome bd-type quinol oxidase subunit 2